ncbi:MAG: D-alanyl-D-alanine carboxypeptidase [Acidobacteria bacterium]|nr:D-alanyl-D-alanine carboxypeptidase [Acidobacteriota bacterium]
MNSAALLATHRSVGLLSLADAVSSNLVWYAEDWSGRPVSAQQPASLANPASMTKMATSLMALHHYGPSFRYRTLFVLDGPVDQVTATLTGDLHVYAYGDPDFHFENAMLVAAALNQLGVAQVTSDLIIHGRFHMGWDTCQHRWRCSGVKRDQLHARGSVVIRHLSPWDGQPHKGCS